MELSAGDQVGLYLFERDAFFVPPRPGNQHVLDILPQRSMFLEVDYRCRLAALRVGDELNPGHGPCLLESCGTCSHSNCDALACQFPVCPSAPHPSRLRPSNRQFILIPIAHFDGRLPHAGDPGVLMPRIVRCSLIQATNAAPPDASLSATKQAMIDKHVAYIEQAARAGAQIVCLQEIFYGPYFCAEQTTKWYDFTEPIPDGPTIRLMRDLAKQYHICLVVPIYEIEQAGIYYNTAAVIDNDGSFLGKYRKSHIPHVAPGFWEKFYFRPGTLGFPVFDFGFVKIGVYICYDRHFPEGARALGLAGAVS